MFNITLDWDDDFKWDFGVNIPNCCPRCGCEDDFEYNTLTCCLLCPCCGLNITKYINFLMNYSGTLNS